MALPGAFIWNDAGSGATLDFGAWGIQAPDDEFGYPYFSRGLFYGADSHTRPADAAVEVLWVVEKNETTDDQREASAANTEMLSVEYI